ncbi:MAG: YihY/virulence factor BrkB family protein [Tepidisphaeraceae bacterium]|jgi:membrane protein
MAQVRSFDGKNYWRRAISRLASIASLFSRAASEWLNDNALRLSAAVSFYAVLSLAPLLVIVIRVMGIAHDRQFAREQIINQTTNLLGAQLADAIKPILDTNVTQNTALATTLSTVVLLYSTTSVFIELQNSLNTIWGVECEPHKTNRASRAVLTFIRTRLLSLAMVFGLGFLLVLFIFISGFLSAFQHHPANIDQWPADVARTAISCAVEFALFGAIFKFMPNVRLRWKDIWRGALIAAILFSAGRFGLAIYFKHARIDNVYGAAGSLLAVLTWVYYSSFSLFFGAEFTKVVSDAQPPSFSVGKESASASARLQIRSR